MLAASKVRPINSSGWQQTAHFSMFCQILHFVREEKSQRELKGKSREKKSGNMSADRENGDQSRGKIRLASGGKPKACEP
jgi:hypothetical protein